jgi:hypothetical protein
MEQDGFIIPDSPNWCFVNSSNVVAVSGGKLAYAAYKKIVVIAIETGKAFQIIFPGPGITVSYIAMCSQSLSAICSDNKIRTYSLQTFSEIYCFPVEQCLGIKYWTNNLICAFQNSCKVFSETEIIREFEIEGFKAISIAEEYLALVSKEEITVFRFIESFQIVGTFVNVSMTKFDDIYIIALSAECVKAYKKDTLLAEIPLKRQPQKLKTPVFSASWVTNSRFAYSTIRGELILVNINPMVQQTFMNNPHTKAIMSLESVNQGLVSVGMDRLLCLWDISEISESEQAPRSYAKAIAYMEPVWEYQTLEASVCEIVAVSDKIVVCCGKPSVLIFDICSNWVHGRSIWKNIPCDVLSVECGGNDELISLRGSEDIIILSITQEKQRKLYGQMKILWFFVIKAQCFIGTLLQMS